ncbi:hypothetical protein [Cytophaga aurantiaca]|uniref:hypothetical protein n=1 Tax=Cytophaga aurantiaca TaxID=29530 RepID=UPI0003610A68|nr:hypothetical protein [Cytophaga aurantiaca]
MKKLLILILGAYILLGCEDSSNKESLIKKTEIVQDTIIDKNTNIHPREEVKIEKIDFDFLTDCDSLDMWQGGIQGINVSDSTGPFIMAQCFANKNFDLIVYSNRKIELKEGTDFKGKSIKNGIAGAEYYAFEIPKKIPEEPENEFDTYDYVYPSEVKIYKLFEDGWYLIKRGKVDSFEELGRLKFNSVYKK